MRRRQSITPLYFVPSYRDISSTDAHAWQLTSMFGQAPKQAVQETQPAQKGQLVNITNKTPTVGQGRTVTSPDKVPQMVEGTEIVTGKRNKRERQELAEEGSFRQQNTLADFQQFAEIDQNDGDEPLKLDLVQESSAEPHKMPPSARRLLPPSDGDPNPPPVRGSYAG